MLTVSTDATLMIVTKGAWQSSTKKVERLQTGRIKLGRWEGCYVTVPSGSLAHAARRKLKKKDQSDNDDASFCLKRQRSNKPACLHKLSSSSSSLD